jgi:hypothetical protein
MKCEMNENTDLTAKNPKKIPKRARNEKFT